MMAHGSIDTLGSTRSLEEYKRGQKSFFDAVTKNQILPNEN